MKKNYYPEKVAAIKRLLSGESFNSVDHFIEELKEYMWYYNNSRIKEKLDGMTPVEYRINYLDSNI